MTASLAALIDRAYLAASTERGSSDLCILDQHLVTDSVLALNEARAAIIADPSLAAIGLESLDALVELLKDIRTFRLLKLLALTACPDHALPVEKVFHAEILRARADLKDAWPSPENPLES